MEPGEFTPLEIESIQSVENRLQVQSMNEEEATCLDLAYRIFFRFYYDY
jgi:hypothetical protein